MKIHKMEQGSNEWHEIRKGKMTASNATAIGNNGKGLETYTKEIVRKELSSKVDEYTNKDFERGHELEPIAREIYELETGNKVEQVGFIEYDEFTGCSPDGLIGKDGGLEVKCPDDKVFFDYMLDKKVDSSYEWQCQMNLLITGRKWWDLVLFNPNFNESIFIIRIEPDTITFDLLKGGLKTGKQQIKLIKQQING